MKSGWPRVLTNPTREMKSRRATWRRDLGYHVHVHYLIPGGGLSPDGQKWRPTKYDYLVPEKAVAKIFRGNFRDLIKKTDLFDQVPSETWQRPWVVDIIDVGSGQAAMKYLAPYIFRVGITNNIIKLKDGKVTFRYRDSSTDQYETKTLEAQEFIRRFLQHVLPHRFRKVRYYGFLSYSLCHHSVSVFRRPEDMVLALPNGL